jgi:hypothetical protein
MRVFLRENTVGESLLRSHESLLIASRPIPVGEWLHNIAFK